MSTLTVTNIQATGETASRAVSGVAAAWVNFDGTGTISIRQSENISSLTDVSTGRYKTNFTNSMSASNYSASGWDHSYGVGWYAQLITTFVDLVRANNNFTAADVANISVTAHGDLA